VQPFGEVIAFGDDLVVFQSGGEDDHGAALGDVGIGDVFFEEDSGLDAAPSTSATERSFTTRSPTILSTGPL
jgi:hypothetical protein